MSGRGMDDLIMECICGENWRMDYEETPKKCVGQIWRPILEHINYDLYTVEYDPGVWVDEEGNEVEPAPEDFGHHDPSKEIHLNCDE